VFSLFQLELPLFGFVHDGSRAPARPAQEEKRSIALNGSLVEYSVRRSTKRRTLGLTIDTRGLRVAAPVKAKQADIERLINHHASWVMAKLREWQRPEHVAAREWSLADPLPWFGQSLPVKVAPGKPGLAVFDDMLILTVPYPEDQKAARERLVALIKVAARADFLARLGRFTIAYGAPLPQLRLTRAATRWGSCARDAAGGHRISLNWRMIHLAPRLIDYVVAHEVAHMRHMHHGPRFWAAVEKLYPDYLSARDEMRRMSLLLPEL
jgi:predicted metal-dependent hydrolase